MLGFSSCQRRRRRLPVMLIVLLLFSQLVAAAYACPNFAKQQEGRSESMADCDGASGAVQMDPERPLLCQASCEDAAQSSGTPASGDVGQATVVLYTIPSSESRDQHLRLPLQVLPSPGQPPEGWPPLYLFNRVLRN